MEPLILDLQVDNAQAISSINAFFDIYEKGVDGMAQSLGQALGKPVEVGVELKMEGDKIVASGVEKINKELDKTITAAKLNNKEFGKTPAEVRKSISILKALRDKTEKYKEGTKEVTDSWAMVTQLLKQATAAMSQFNNVAKSGGSSLFSKLVSSQVAADALMGSFRGLVSGVSNFISTGAEMEVLFLQLKGFTGGVEQASAAYQRFVEIGQATPFTARQVATAARTMMGFGIATQDAIEQTGKLAIVASATGGDLGMMGRNLGQIQANQKAYTRDLMQFANQGIPIYQELANVMDTSTQHVRELAEEGKIGFSQVSAALSNMTAEGTVFSQIAAEMDKTFSAKAEAMQSAFENFAGQTLAGLNKLDQAMGGPIVGTMETIIDGLNTLASIAKTLGDNARIAAPIIASLGAALITAAATAIRWKRMLVIIRKLAVVQGILTAKTWTLNSALAVKNALMMNFAVVALAAGAAASIAAIQAGKYAEEQEKLNAKMQESTDSQEEQKVTLDSLGERVAMLTKGHRDLGQQYVDNIAKLKENQDAAKTNAEMALSWIKEENEERKAALDERMKGLDLAFDKERQNYRDLKDSMKNYYDSIITAEKEAQSAMRERHNQELELIDAKTPAERALQELQKRKLLNEQKGLQVGTEEWLQIQVRLDGMARQEQRQAAITRHKRESAAQEARIKEVENQKTSALAQEEQRFKAKEKTYREEKRMIKEQKMELEKLYKYQEQKINQVFDTLDRRQFDSHQDAMTYIDQQIANWKRLGREKEAALKKGDEGIGELEELQKTGRYKLAPVEGGARVPTSKLGTNFLASGGPIAGGQTAIVNELGKEAFLSASGRLSMINAPSWGQWTAPTSGTVIPAHLAKELNIPAGGINLNQPAGMSRRAASPAMSGGDVFHQNVTVQAANPVQAANSMMVEMTRLRRRRFG